MNKSNDWYSFYKPYIEISDLFDIDTIVENYIKQNYYELIENQFEQYKEQGRYTRAGEFIDKEIKAGLKNPDSYYLELKKRNRKDITDILSKIKKLPLIVDYVDYIEDLKYGGNSEYSYLRDTLELGETFLNRPECCHYLLWIFSTTDEDNDKEFFKYGSSYLEKVARAIKKTAEQFNSINSKYYKISLECYKKFINIDDFLTKKNIKDLYIRMNYSEILKDEFKLYKENITQDKFMREKELYNGYDDGRFLYNSLTKGKKKLDKELLKKFRKFKIFKKNNNTSHSQNIEKLEHIRLALQMGALAFQKFPRLSTDISNAMKNAQYEGYGILYLKELSRQLNIVAYNEWKIEDNIESDYQQEKQYKENMSSQEYDEAKLLGFDIWIQKIILALKLRWFLILENNNTPTKSCGGVYGGVSAETNPTISPLASAKRL